MGGLMMSSITKKMGKTTGFTIKADLTLFDPSPVLWEIDEAEPEIRQIYGHFLPPAHRRFDRGHVAKDFNFPPAYHDSSNLRRLTEGSEIEYGITCNSIVSLCDSIKIRAEGEGAIVYTPYFNGFYVNNRAYTILKYCQNKVTVDSIITKSGFDPEIIIEFLTRTLALDIINVYSS